jgi:serine phosphatase RsbU (regulator of sigma subunit)
MKRILFLILVSFPIHFFCGNPKIDSLLRITSAGKQDTATVKACIHLSGHYEIIGEFDNGIDAGKQGLALAEKIKWKKGQADCLKTIANCLNRKGDYKEAEGYVDKALKEYRLLNELRGIANCYSMYGVLQKNQGNYAAAIENHLTALQYAKQSGQKKVIAGVYGNIGNVYVLIGDLKKGIENLLESQKLFEDEKQTVSIGINLANLASLYMKIMEFDVAISYYEKSMKIKEETGDKNGVAMAAKGIGSAYMQKKDYAKALGYYEAALNAVTAEGDKKLVSSVYMEVAYVKYKLGRKEEGIKDINEAIRIKKAMGDKHGLGITYAKYSDMMLQEGKTQEAEKYIKMSLKLGEETGTIPLQAEMHAELYRLYKKNGTIAKALLHYEKHVELLDSMSESENQKVIEQKQMQYEFAKKTMADSIRHNSELKAGELEIGKKNAELKHERSQRFLLYGGIIFLLVMAAIVGVAYRNKKRDNKEIQLQKTEIVKQKEIVEEKQKEIVDSINYAKTIQYALLANEDMLKKNIPDYFILFMPKDIVSGDFYWATKKNERFYLAVCDCTGHGVPGAFMSLLNISFLNEAVNEKNISEPSEVFDHVRRRLIENVSQGGGQDGMDGILLWIDPKNDWVKYAAAHNHPIVVNRNKATEFPADKMPVGKGELTNSFRLFNLPVEKGDTIYLSTDGYSDQFGGPKGKKFKYKKMVEEFIKVSTHPMPEQKNILQSAFTGWKGGLEQVDDVCVMGIRF